MRFLEWCFRNRQTGRITVAQSPNLPLWIFFVMVIARWIVRTDGVARTSVDAIAVAALGWWATDELFRGVNPWRRLLGLIGGAFAVAGLVSPLLRVSFLRGRGPLVPLILPWTVGADHARGPAYRSSSDMPGVRRDARTACVNTVLHRVAARRVR
jgi:hypothetical protein